METREQSLKLIEKAIGLSNRANLNALLYQLPDDVRIHIEKGLYQRMNSITRIDKLKCFFGFHHWSTEIKLGNLVEYKQCKRCLAESVRSNRTKCDTILRIK